MENNIDNKGQIVDCNLKYNEDEIDIVRILQKLWNNRKFILRVTGIFAAFGLIAIISIPNYYSASCTIIPQSSQNNSGGSLSGLAAMAGINIGALSSGSTLSPSVYPKIMANVNFQKELIYSKLNFNDANQPITLYEYYTNKKYRRFNLLETIKKYSIGLPGVIIGALKSKPREVETQKISVSKLTSTSIQSLTADEKQVSNIVKGHLSLNLTNKDGSISLSSNMPESVAAAELVQKGLELLQKYITAFKIEKVTNNLEFVEKSYEEAKLNFEIKQKELAKFRDTNKSFTSAVAKTQEEKLMSEYTLLLGIYTELAKQKEQAKIAVTETTPIFTVIEPIVVPIEKTKPNRNMLLFAYTFFGFIIGSVIVFAIPYLEINFIPNIKKYRFIPKIV